MKCPYCKTELETLEKFIIRLNIHERGHFVGRTILEPKKTAFIEGGFRCPNCLEVLTRDQLVAQDILTDK
jgi:uncharacterized protein with PIN domain